MRRIRRIQEGGLYLHTYTYECNIVYQRRRHSFTLFDLRIYHTSILHTISVVRLANERSSGIFHSLTSQDRYNMHNNSSKHSPTYLY